MRQNPSEKKEKGRWMPVVSSAHLWLDGAGELAKMAQSARDQLAGVIGESDGSLRGCWLIGWIKEQEGPLDEEALAEALLEVSEGARAERNRPSGPLGKEAIRSIGWAVDRAERGERIDEMIESVTGWTLMEAPCGSWRPEAQVGEQDMRRWRSRLEEIARKARDGLARIEPIRGVKIEAAPEIEWLGETPFKALREPEWKVYASRVRAMAEAIELREQIKGGKIAERRLKSTARM